MTPPARRGSAHLPPLRDVLAVCLLAVLAYVPSLGGAFVYDDVPLVRDDLRVTGGAVRSALATPYWGAADRGGLYRPVATLSFVLNGFLGKGPLPFRAVNLALHAGASVLALVLARRILGSRSGALVAAVLFAVHPIHVEVAANVVGRCESLAFLLAGGAWVVATEAAASGSAAGLVLAAALALLGALAKESAVLVALAAPLEILVLGRARPARRALLAATAALPAVVAVGIALALRVRVLGAGAFTPGETAITAFMNPLAAEPFPVRLANAPLLLLAYAKHVAWPLSLSPDYGGDFLPLAKDPGDPRVVGWAAGVLALVVVPVLASRTRARAVAFGAAFFVLSLGAVLQVATPIGTLLADRLAYAPSFGFLLVLGAGAGAALERSRERRLLVRGALALASGVLASVACSDALAWGDGVALFERARERAPASAQVQIVLALAYLQRAEECDRQGDAAGARELREKAIAPLDVATHLVPREPGPHLHKGRVHRLRGELDAAVRELERGLSLGPDRKDASGGRSELGMTLWGLGDLRGAERELGLSVEIEPDAKTLMNLGQVRRLLGDQRGARAALERSLELDPIQPNASEIRKILDGLRDR